MSLWGSWKDMWRSADEHLGFKPDHREVRRTRQLQNEQINAYREQTRITNEQLKDAKERKATEKRRLDEKQVRRLRRGYRAPGFLENSNEGGAAVTDKLGG